MVFYTFHGCCRNIEAVLRDQFGISFGCNCWKGSERGKVFAYPSGLC
jgi:hypothetical protein